MTGSDPGSAPGLGFAFVIGAALLWATVGVASRLMPTPEPPGPALMGFCRTLLGALALIGAAELARVPRVPIARMPFRTLAVFGIAGAVFQVTLFAAFRDVGVTITSAVTVVAPPVIVAAGAALLDRRRPPVGVSSAIALATTGIVLAVYGATAPAETSEPEVGWWGAGLLAVNSFAFVAMAITVRRLGAILHPIRSASLGLMAVASVLATSILVGGSPTDAVATIAGFGAADLGLLVFTGVIATGGAYLAFTAGMALCRHPGVGLAATMVEPVFAAILATAILSEPLTPVALAGCALMLVAMGVLYRAERKAPA